MGRCGPETRQATDAPEGSRGDHQAGNPQTPGGLVLRGSFQVAGDGGPGGSKGEEIAVRSPGS